MFQRNRILRVVTFLVMAWSFLSLAGCQNGPPRGEVSGSVTVAGQPLEAGRILFVPQPPLEASTITTLVKGGVYRVEAAEGPIVGTYRVEVEAELPLGFPLDDDQAFAARGGLPLPPNPIPPQFNRHSTLSTEIKPGPNTFDVAVPIQP